MSHKLYLYSQYFMKNYKILLWLPNYIILLFYFPSYSTEGLITDLHHCLSFLCIKLFAFMASWTPGDSLGRKYIRQTGISGGFQHWKHIPIQRVFLALLKMSITSNLEEMLKHLISEKLESLAIQTGLPLSGCNEAHWTQICLVLLKTIT